MGEKAKVIVLFPSHKPGTIGWPYINYDFEGRAEDVMRDLRYSLPEIEFTEYMVYSREDVEKIKWRGEGIDGFVVYYLRSLPVVDILSESGLLWF